MTAEELVYAVVEKSLGMEFEGEGHVYRWDGKKIPSCSRIIGPPPPDIPAVQYAMARGSRVDAAINEIEDGTGEGWDYLEHEDFPFIESFLEWKEENDWQCAARQLQACGAFEMPWGDTFRWGCTLDGVYVTERGLTIVDDKTRGNPETKPMKRYRLQTAGYQIAAVGEFSEDLEIHRCLRMISPECVEIVWHEDVSDLFGFASAASVKAWEKQR